MSVNDQELEFLKHFEWRVGNILYCRDCQGKVFRAYRNYETVTSVAKKTLFVKETNDNGIIYERKIKKVKVGTREENTNKVSLSLGNAECCFECSDLAEDRKEKLQSLPNAPDCRNSECPDYHAELNAIYKKFQSPRKKHLYEVVGYRFVQFYPPPTPRKSKIDEKPFLERLNHANYRTMLLQDIKLLFHLQTEYALELCEFLAIVITSYQENLDGAHEVKAFQKIVEKIIRTAKTPTGKPYFLVGEDEKKILVSKN